jgi:hypothetical protein
VTPLLAQLGFFRAKFHSKSLYSVEKKIVGISQYAYFSAANNVKSKKKNRKSSKIRLFKKMVILKQGHFFADETLLALGEDCLISSCLCCTSAFDLNTRVT